MPNKTIITITHNESSADMTHMLKKDVGDYKSMAIALERYFGAVAGGVRHAQIDIQVAEGVAAAASGTLTLAGVIAGDTCSVNNVTFTAVASGATGNQFNVGANDTATAANLAAAINASSHANISGLVSASSAGAVVTVSAAKKGKHGNIFPLVGNVHITASGAAMAGGVDSVPSSKSYGL